MRPGERVTLIKKIAASMAAEMDPREAALVLGQFGIPPNFRGGSDMIFDLFTSVVDSIQGADDDALLGLHEYLFGEAAPSPGHGSAQAIAEDVWSQGSFRLFLSHTHAHRVDIGFLKTLLRSYGIDGFVAHDDIEPTREWQDVIESALATCEALLAWLTEDFPGSRWTDQEVGFCVGRSVLVIPVRRGLDPYGFIYKYQGIQGAGKAMQVIASEVRRILVTHQLTATRMVASTVRLFLTVNTYKAARDTFELLNQLPPGAWTEALLDDLESGAGNNDQITAAFYGSGTLPERVGALVRERRAELRGEAP